MWDIDWLQPLRLLEDSGAFREMLGAINDPAIPWALAIAILLLALVDARRFYRKLRPISRRVQRANELLSQSPNEPEEFARQSYETVREHLSADPVLGASWREFEETLVLPHPDDSPYQVQNTARPDIVFGEGTVVAPRVNLRHFQAVPNLLVGLGLLFTFIGLVAALYFASQGFDAKDIADTKTALGDLLHAATFKFVTSVAGLFASLLFSLAEKWRLHKLQGRLSAFCRLLEERLVLATPEKIALEQLRAAKEQSLQLQRFNTDLAASIAEALDRGALAESASRTLTSIEDLTKSGSATLEAVRTMSETLAAKLDSLGDRFGDANQQALEEMLRTFAEKVTAGAGTEFASLGTELRELTRAFTRASTDLDSKLQGLSQELGGIGGSLRGQFESFFQKMEAAFDKAAGALDQGAGRFGKEMQGATEDLIGKLSEATASLANTVEKGGAELGDRLAQMERGLGTVVAALQSEAKSAVAGVGKAVEDAGSKLRGETTGFGNDVKQAAEHFRREVTAAVQGMKQMADDFSESVLILDGVVEKAKPAGEAIAQAQAQIQQGIASLSQASQAVKSAADQLGQQGQTARATVVELQALAQSIRESTNALNKAWDQHQQRFEQVDQNAAKMFQEINTGLQAYTKQVQDFVTGLDKSLAQATSQLGGVVQELQSTAEEMTDAARRFQVPRR